MVFLHWQAKKNQARNWDWLHYKEQDIIDEQTADDELENEELRTQITQIYVKRSFGGQQRKTSTRYTKINRLFYVYFHFFVVVR